MHLEKLPGHENYQVFTSCKLIIINSNNEFLLIKRSPDSQHFKNKFELPGGKIGPYESDNFGLYREIYEETGLLINLENTKIVRIQTKHINDPTSIYHQKIIKLKAGMVHYNFQPNHIQLSSEHHQFEICLFDEKILNRRDITDNSLFIIEKFLRSRQND